MQDETATFFDGTAAHHGAVPDTVGQADDGVGISQVQLVQNVRKSQIGQFVIDHQAHGALGPVANNENNALREAFIGHVRHGNQELTFETVHEAIVGLDCRPAKVGAVLPHHEGLNGCYLVVHLLLR